MEEFEAATGGGFWVAIRAILMLSGCVTMERNPNTNLIPDPYWTDRDYAPPGTIGPNNGDVEVFVGRVAYKGADGKWHFIGNPVFKGTPALKVITDPVTYEFHTYLDSKYSGTATLPGLNLSGNAEAAYDCWRRPKTDHLKAGLPIQN